jgi:hypothetical protein
MVPTSATIVQHLTRLLSVPRHICPRHVVTSDRTISKIPSECSHQYRNAHSKLYPDLSTGSHVETCGQTGRRKRTARNAFSPCTSCKAQVTAPLVRFPAANLVLYSYWCIMPSSIASSFHTCRCCQDSIWRTSMILTHNFKFQLLFNGAKVRSFFFCSSLNLLLYLAEFQLSKFNPTMIC